MNAPLTPEREAEIRSLDLLALMDDRVAAAISGHLAALLAEMDRLRGELADSQEDVAFLHRNTLPDLHRQIQHHQDGKARWRGRAEKAEGELKKYVGVEPTVADENAYLTRCLNAVYEACDQAEKQSTRCEHPLPVPEWVVTVRQAADGDRPDSPDDRRRRIYLDGNGKAWLDQSVGNGITWVAPVAIFPGDSEPASTVRERANGLHEIGRCL